MKCRLWVIAALAMCACTNSGHQSPAGAISLGPLKFTSYEDLLDGNQIHPIEGARGVSIHVAPSFSFTHTESGEIGGKSVVRFERVITGVGEIHPSQDNNLALVMRMLTDTRNAGPTSSELLLYDPKGEPSVVGGLAEAIMTSYGKTLSIETQGSGPNQPYTQWILKRCIPVTPLAADNGLQQGHLISYRRQILWLDLEINARVTVLGEGTYHRRPVVVLGIDGDAEAPHQKKVGSVSGYAFVDEKVGIISAENVQVILPASAQADTRSMVLLMSSTFELP
jgi:hypothetical protein